jgi:hypothetical protein
MDLSPRKEAQMSSIHAGLAQRLAAMAATVEAGPLRFTPPGSPTSAIIGAGLTGVVPRSVQDPMLIVNHVRAATPR